MDNKKFEQLIDFIVNENEEQARALFHNIVVEKSREIYESMMEMDDMEEGLGGQVGDMLDEITREESGMMESDDEDEDDFGDEELGVGDNDAPGPDGEMPVDDESVDSMGDMDDADMDAMDADAESGEEDLEDRVVDLEDKLDQLMAEFEEIMNKDEGDEEEAADDEEMAADDEEAAADDEEEAADDEEAEEMMEAKLVKVAPVHHGDDGSNKQSVSLRKPSFQSPAHPFSLGSGDGGKGSSTPNVKPSQHSYANQGGGRSPELYAVAKPPKTQSAGNTRSPVAESKKVSGKPVSAKKK